MRLLHVIGTLNPAYGGPAEAIRQISSALTRMGHRIEVVTLDGVGDPWVSGFPGVVHALGPSIGKYRYNKRLIPWLKIHSRDYHAVLVHGIWQFQSYGTWLAARSDSTPYFVFIHGALDPWFKRAYPLKHVKKWLYWPWADYRVLRDAQAVLFTSDGERMLASRSFWLYQANDVVVDYGILDPGGDPHGQREHFFRNYPATRNKRLLLFLSRIHQKKGCDLLIEAFAKLAVRDRALHLVMAGPDQEGWQRKLVDLARTRGVEDRITWTGMLTGDMKWGAFHAAEVFVLPSHSENFGIVIAESLACGVPVLISNKVNIWREIVQDGAGFAEPDTLEGTVALLERWLCLSADELHQMRDRARVCYEDRFEIQQTAKKLASVIEQSLLERTGKTVQFGRLGVDSTGKQAKTAPSSRTNVREQGSGELPALVDRVYMVGAFPPPMHGMSVVNGAVYGQLERMGIPLVAINIAAPSLDRSLSTRLARLPNAFRGMLRFGIRARRGETLYMSVSGGFGQLYEVLFLLLARLHGMRIFLHHHSYAYLDQRKALSGVLVSVAGSDATHITQSDGLTAKLRHTYQAKRVVAISNAVLLLEEIESVAPPRTLTKIGYLGNISAEKGVFEFLDVAEKLEAVDQQIRAVLAGPFQDSKIERLVRERLARLRSVDYAGPMFGPDKVAFFRDIDVLLFPTRYVNEAEPLTIHEAMMHGVPVISYGRGAIGEIVSSDCGLVIDPSQDFVSRAVAQLQVWKESPQALQQASKAARECFLGICGENKERWESVRAEMCG